MDPKATLAIVNDAEASKSERIEALVNLAEWLSNLGMIPAGTLTAEAVRFFWKIGLDAKAFRVRSMLAARG